MGHSSVSAGSCGRGGMADAPDLGSGVSDVRVRVSSSALYLLPGRQYAVVAQLVERHLAKVEVASPSLVYRSNAPLAQLVEHLTLNQGVPGSSP